MITKSVLAIVGAATLVVGSCGTDAATPSGIDPSAPTILVSTSIWADVLANVACGGLARVETIIPVGAEPHAFEPSLADRAAMDDAVLIVANGLRLEAGLDDTIDAAADAGTPVFRVAEHVELIEFTFAADDDHGDDALDPHVWFDPTRVASMLPELAERLVSDAGLDPIEVERCTAAYEEQLIALDTEIEQMTAGVEPERRRLVTSHDALGYFADRYDFEIIGTIIPVPSGLAETNPAQMQELAVVVEQSGVPAVFAEAQRSSDDADALASSVGGVEVITLLTGSLGQPGSGSSTYLDLLRTNAQRITEALSADR